MLCVDFFVSDEIFLFVYLVFCFYDIFFIGKRDSMITKQPSKCVLIFFIYSLTQKLVVHKKLISMSVVGLGIETSRSLHLDISILVTCYTRAHCHAMGEPG